MDEISSVANSLNIFDNLVNGFRKATFKIKKDDKDENIMAAQYFGSKVLKAHYKLKTIKQHSVEEIAGLFTNKWNKEETFNKMFIIENEQGFRMAFILQHLRKIDLESVTVDWIQRESEEQDFSNLKTALTRKGNFAIINGMSNSGKTDFAKKYAYNNYSDIGGEVWLLRFVDPEENEASFPRDVIFIDNKYDLKKNILKNIFNIEANPKFWIIDNLKKGGLSEAKKIAESTPSIFTTRDETLGKANHRVKIEPFTPNESNEYLKKILQDTILSEEYKFSDTEIQIIQKYVGNLPGHLNYIAENLINESWKFIQDLRSNFERNIPEEKLELLVTRLMLLKFKNGDEFEQKIFRLLKHDGFGENISDQIKSFSKELKWIKYDNDDSYKLSNETSLRIQSSLEEQSNIEIEAREQQRIDQIRYEEKQRIDQIRYEEQQRIDQIRYDEKQRIDQIRYDEKQRINDITKKYIKINKKISKQGNSETITVLLKEFLNQLKEDYIYTIDDFSRNTLLKKYDLPNSSRNKLLQGVGNKVFDILSSLDYIEKTKYYDSIKRVNLVNWSGLYQLHIAKNLVKAESIFKEALGLSSKFNQKYTSLNKEIPKENHLITAKVLTALCLLKYNQKKDDEAIEYGKKAEEIFKKRLSPEVNVESIFFSLLNKITSPKIDYDEITMHYAQLMFYLGRTYRFTPDNLDKAIRYLNESKENFNKLVEINKYHGKVSIGFGFIEMQLAGCYFTQKKYQESSEHAIKAYEIFQEKLQEEKTQEKKSQYFLELVGVLQLIITLKEITGYKHFSGFEKDTLAEAKGFLETIKSDKNNPWINQDKLTTLITNLDNFEKTINDAVAKAKNLAELMQKSDILDSKTIIIEIDIVIKNYSLLPPSKIKEFLKSLNTNKNQEIKEYVEGLNNKEGDNFWTALQNIFDQNPENLKNQEGPLEQKYAEISQHPNITKDNKTMDLMSAISKGDTKIAKDFIGNGVDVNTSMPNGVTILMLSIEKGNKELIEYLIQEGADVNKSNLDGRTPLMTAAYLGDIETFKQLITNGADLYDETKTGQTALMLAEENNQEEIVLLIKETIAQLEGKEEVIKTQEVKTLVDQAVTTQLSNSETDKNHSLIIAAKIGFFRKVKDLLEKGANPEAKSVDGETPLMLAAQHGHTEVAKLLVKRIENVDTASNEGLTPLIYAAQYGHKDFIEVLINAGADINFSTRSATNALTLIALNGNIDMVKFLIEKSADVNAVDNSNYTPLMGAAQHGHAEVTKLLIAAGANVNAQEKKNSTALMCAITENKLDTAKLLIENDKSELDLLDGAALRLTAEQNRPEMTKLLIDNGASVHLHDKDGETPLMTAAVKGHIKVVRLLIDASIDSGIDAVAYVNKARLDGLTSLIFAADNGQTEVVKLLIEKGANIKAKHVSGLNAFMVAVNNNHLEVVKLLIKNMNINAEDNNGKSALNYAQDNGNNEIVEIINEAIAGLKGKENPEKDDNTINDLLGFHDTSNEQEQTVDTTLVGLVPNSYDDS